MISGASITMNYLNVYFIRHADSYNNALYQLLQSEMGDVGDAALEKEEAARREPDCGISATGEYQLELLQDYIRSGGWSFMNSDNCHIFTSPMSRCLMTASAIVAALPKTADGPRCVKVRRDLFETGGCFTYTQNGVTDPSTPIGLPGATAREIEAQYNFQCEPGMENGWYNRTTKETDEEFDSRAIDVANWLWAEARKITTPTTYLLVIHGNLMSAILNALSTGSPRNALFLHSNTALSHVQLFPRPPPEAALITSLKRDVCAIQAVNYAPHLDHPRDLQALKIGNDAIGDHWVQEF